MSFNQGLSGLNGASKNLDVIGNNIANTSTVGFKASRAEFSDVYAASINGVSNLNVGIGTKTAAVVQQFTQGNISVTNNPLDLAISGDGFFQLVQTDPNSPTATTGLTTFTRNGQFQMDKNGYIVDNAGRKLIGFPATEGVVIPGTLQPIKVSLGVAKPNPTSTAQIIANLDSTSTAPTGAAFGAATPATAINPATPSTYNYSTTFTVYDTPGSPLGLTLYFQKAGAGWNVAGYVGGNQVLPVGDATVAGTETAMTLAFAADGTVATINGAAVAPLTTTAAGTMPSFSLDLSLLTQYGSTSGVSFVSQDGYSTGKFVSLSVDKTGLVQGRYTNGQALAIGQILMTNFLNPNGLQPLGDNQWGETTAAGKQSSEAPGTGVLGYLQSGVVEESNVDLTAELVNMIVAQRMYQANAQTVKTQDSILQTLVNLR
ncbi:MAG: flagellar hook protein FlgE [Pseudomonadota bacterium]|nr:flagellar hook protein FlgE [Pseudomonadota bacterium]